jgi:hypothetical protein
MKRRLFFTTLLLLALVPTALASATWYVNGVTGSDSNDCKSSTTACKTIGHAISLAASGDSIMVATATYTENLAIGLNLKIIGSAAATTIIDGGGLNTVVTISNTSANVTLSKVTVRNGVALHGGGIYNSGNLTIQTSIVTTNTAGGAFATGGGVYNAGTLTVNRSTLSGNTAAYGGGGIENLSTVTVNNSTLTGNSAPFGGGVVNDGTLSINNSTISGNSSLTGGSGGGLYNLASHTLTINNSTLAGNSADSGGGAISNSGTAVLQNTIVTDSPSGGNCSGTVTSKGYNLSSDTTCNFNNTGDLNNTDPKVEPLGNYGGPTQTIALREGSPAIDAGNPNGCTNSRGQLLKTDQRGAPRPDKEDSGGCDMGAFEKQSD